MNRLLLMGMMFVLALVSFQSWGAARVPCSQEDEEWCQAIYELDEAWCWQNWEISECCFTFCMWNAQETKDHCLLEAGCEANPPAPMPDPCYGQNCTYWQKK